VHTKDQLGLDGENYAVRYLVGSGYSILARNWRCPVGEIDIIAADGSTLVFIEVKTRTSTAFGLPLEAVNWRKTEKLKALSVHWLREHRHAGPFRFDVISIVMPKHCRPELQHVRAAF
jgi:putative endonuclease